MGFKRCHAERKLSWFPFPGVWKRINVCFMLLKPHFIASEIFRQSRFTGKHPLNIPRVSVTVDLIRALGWMEEDRYIDGPVATVDQLRRFHDPDYVQALIRAESDGLSEEDKDRWQIGRNGNPIYPEVFRRPATAAGSSILAAEMVAQGGTVHSPAGGTHHGRRDRASGFCFLNDPVLAILRLLDLGVSPIAYVDLDAHHGDGVEDAFLGDERVTTISLHEVGRWPRTGDANHGHGRSIVNLPVPSGFNDSEFHFVLESAVLPLVEECSPAALVIQCGVDGLADDPLSKLSLSNGAYWRAVADLLPMAKRRIVLGGGGYNPYAVARAWSGVWAIIDGHPIPDQLPVHAQQILDAIYWKHSSARNPPSRWTKTLADPPNHGAIREDVRHLVRSVMAQ